MKKTSLDKKFDKLRFLEENNKLVSKDQNRLISKFLNNKLAVLGLIIFSIIRDVLCPDRNGIIFTSPPFALTVSDPTIVSGV